MAKRTHKKQSQKKRTRKTGNMKRPKYYENFQELLYLKTRFLNGHSYSDGGYINESELKSYGFTDKMISEMLGDPAPIQEVEDYFSASNIQGFDPNTNYWELAQVDRAMEEAIGRRLNKERGIPDDSTPPEGFKTVSQNEIFSSFGPTDAFVTVPQLRRAGFSKRDLKKLPEPELFPLGDSEELVRHWKIEDVRDAVGSPGEGKAISRDHIRLNLEMKKGNAWYEICEEYRKAESS